MKKTSIRLAILIPSLVVLIAGMAILIATVSALSFGATQNLTDQIIHARVKEYSGEFRSFNQDIYGALETIAPIVAGLSHDENRADLRGEVVDILSGVLTTNGKISSIWTCWEPDAFDGRDRLYADTPLHDATGRFAVHIYRQGDSFGAEALLDCDDPVLGHYYQGARAAGAPYVTDPYAYTIDGVERAIYSLAIPILDDGAVVGAVGVDVNLGDVVAVMNAGSILEDGYLYTLSPGGLVATHPDSAMLMSRYDGTWMAGYRSEVESALGDGGDFSVSAHSDITGTDMIFLGSSVAIGSTGRNWLVCGVVPQKTANAASMSLIVAILIIGLALIAVVALTIRRIIVAPLRVLSRLTAAAEAIAVGDLDIELREVDTAGTKNEIDLLTAAFAHVVNGIRGQEQVTAAIGQGDYSMTVPMRSDRDTMIMAINRMLDNTNDTLHRIMEASDRVSGGAKQVAQGAQGLAGGATEQAATVQQFRAAVGDIARKSEHSAHMAREAAQLSDVIKTSSERGSLQMGHMIEAVSAIKASSDAIGKIIKAIDDIAFQTNILSLNAAVEAARAGQHGKGFAVVAEEVRSLAARSAEASRETGELIASSIERANAGYQIASETAASLGDIIDGIDKNTALILQIAAASEEQSGAVAEIDMGIGQISDIVQQNSATAEELASASDEMSAQAEALQKLTARFKLRGDDTPTAGEVPGLPEPTYAL